MKNEIIKKDESTFDKLVNAFLDVGVALAEAFLEVCDEEDKVELKKFLEEMEEKK